MAIALSIAQSALVGFRAIILAVEPRLKTLGRGALSPRTLLLGSSSIVHSINSDDERPGRLAGIDRRDISSLGRAARSSFRQNFSPLCLYL